MHYSEAQENVRYEEVTFASQILLSDVLHSLNVHQFPRVPPSLECQLKLFSILALELSASSSCLDRAYPLNLMRNEWGRQPKQWKEMSDRSTIQGYLTPRLCSHLYYSLKMYNS